MQTSIENREMAALFDRFSTAFTTFDGREVGRLFATPGVALRQDGSIVGFAAPEDLQRYYQGALDSYRSAGCTVAAWSDLAAFPVSPTAATATVSWDLLDQSGVSVRRWRQAYHLARFPAAELLIYGSAFVSSL